jgi:hypothetical protein
VSCEFYVSLTSPAQRGVDFAMTSSTTAIGCARLVAIINVNQADITYSEVWARVFSALECSVAVSLSCIPLLRPLLGRGTYSKSGTAEFQATSWRGSRPTISGRRTRNVFERMDDDSLELELRPNGPEHRADVVHDKVFNANDGIRPTSGSEDNIMVSHEWNVTSHVKELS